MIYFLYPQLQKLSGAERLILRLASALTELAVPVTLVTHYLDSSCRPALDRRVRLKETGRRPLFFRNHYLDAPFEYLYSMALLGHIGPDAQAVTFFGPPSLPALARSERLKKQGTPRLYFCYEPPRFAYYDTPEVLARLGPPLLTEALRPLFGLYRKLDRTMARQADAMLANSSFGAERLRAAYGRPATVVTHGADWVPPEAGHVEMLRERYGLTHKCVLLTVNFLHPRKRIDLFLRALAELRARRPDTVGLIVGTGPEAGRLKTVARELELDESAIFAGFVPDPELPAHYALADLYMHTGKLESFGLSVLEASAAGIPVVAVSEGGPCEIVADGETGRLVPANPQALASAAAELLGNAPLRADMAEAARRRVAEHYSWRRGAQTFIEVVQGLETAPAK